MTTDFAKKLIVAEDLSSDEITDYLGVSYSSNDYIGHFFGPSSLESEDNILQLDRTLAIALNVVLSVASLTFISVEMSKAVAAVQAAPVPTVS